jgi:hypothetical protein
MHQFSARTPDDLSWEEQNLTITPTPNRTNRITVVGEPEDEPVVESKVEDDDYLLKVTNAMKGIRTKPKPKEDLQQKFIKEYYDAITKAMETSPIKLDKNEYTKFIRAILHIIRTKPEPEHRGYIKSIVKDEEGNPIINLFKQKKETLGFETDEDYDIWKHDLMEKIAFCYNALDLLINFVEHPDAKFKQIAVFFKDVIFQNLSDEYKIKYTEDMEAIFEKTNGTKIEKALKTLKSLLITINKLVDEESILDKELQKETEQKVIKNSGVSKWFYMKIFDPLKTFFTYYDDIVNKTNTETVGQLKNQAFIQLNKLFPEMTFEELKNIIAEVVRDFEKDKTKFIDANRIKLGFEATKKLINNEAEKAKLAEIAREEAEEKAKLAEIAKKAKLAEIAKLTEKAKAEALKEAEKLAEQTALELEKEAEEEKTQIQKTIVKPKTTVKKIEPTLEEIDEELNKVLTKDNEILKLDSINLSGFTEDDLKLLRDKIQTFRNMYGTKLSTLDNKKSKKVIGLKDKLEEAIGKIQIKQKEPLTDASFYDLQDIENMMSKAPIKGLRWEDKLKNAITKDYIYVFDVIKKVDIKEGEKKIGTKEINTYKRSELLKPNPLNSLKKTEDIDMGKSNLIDGKNPGHIYDIEAGNYFIECKYYQNTNSSALSLPVNKFIGSQYYKPFYQKDKVGNDYKVTRIEFKNGSFEKFKPKDIIFVVVCQDGIYYFNFSKHFAKYQKYFTIKKVKKGSEELYELDKTKANDIKIDQKDMIRLYIRKEDTFSGLGIKGGSLIDDSGVNYGKDTSTKNLKASSDFADQYKSALSDVDMEMPTLKSGSKKDRDTYREQMAIYNKKVKDKEKGFKQQYKSEIMGNLDDQFLKAGYTKDKNGRWTKPASISDVPFLDKAIGWIPGATDFANTAIKAGEKVYNKPNIENIVNAGKVLVDSATSGYNMGKKLADPKKLIKDIAIEQGKKVLGMGIKDKNIKLYKDDKLLLSCDLLKNLKVMIKEKIEKPKKSHPVYTVQNDKIKKYVITPNLTLKKIT